MRGTRWQTVYHRAVGTMLVWTSVLLRSEPMRSKLCGCASSEGLSARK